MANLRTKPFFTDVPGALPYTYTVPGTVELVTQSIVARFDGSAAAASFVPCVSVYTQDGRLMARVRLDQVFAAGDTGVGTWAPFLRRVLTGTTPVSTNAAIARLSAAAFNPPASVTTAVPWDSFDTSDTTVFQTSLTSGGAANNTTGDTWIRMVGAGVYIIYAETDWSGGAAGQFIQFARGNFPLLAEGGLYPNKQTPSATYDGNQFVIMGVQDSFTAASFLRVLVNDNASGNTVDVSIGLTYIPAGDLNTVF